MVRYTLLLIALSAATLGAQAPAKQPWIGTMEYRDAAGLHTGRLRIDQMVLSGNVTVMSADWRSLGGASGQLRVTMDPARRLTGTLTIFGGAEWLDEDGRLASAVPERCQGKATVEGVYHDTGVIRLVTDRVVLDTPSLRAVNRHCANMSRVVILLQPTNEH